MRFGADGSISGYPSAINAASSRSFGMSTQRELRAHQRRCKARLKARRATIGGNYDDNGQSVGSNKFWLLTLDENYITIYHPGKYSGGVDWDDSGWYAYFKTEAGTDSE